MRPPGVWGKATVMPGVNPLPFSSRVPWVETSCALVLHLAVGMQLTLVIRTVRTCRLVEACLGAVLCDGALLPVAPAGALVEPVGAVPPGRPRLPAPPGRPESIRSGTTAAQKRLPQGKNGSLRGAVRQQESPSAPENLVASNRRPSTLAAVPEQTEQRQRSCVNPSESLARRAWA